MPLVWLVVFKFNSSTWTSTASSSLTLPSIYQAATFVMYPRRALGDITSVNDVAFSSEVCFHSHSLLGVFVSVCCGFWGLLFVEKTFCSYTPPLVLVIFSNLWYQLPSPPLLFFFLSVETPRHVYRVLTLIRPVGLFSSVVLQGVCTGPPLSLFVFHSTLPLFEIGRAHV